MTIEVMTGYDLAPRGTRQADEILIQLIGLLAVKSVLPMYSKFGDDNHAPIFAQVAVLKGETSAESYYVDEEMEDYEDGDNDTYFAAEQAELWLKGQHDEEHLFDFDDIPDGAAIHDITTRRTYTKEGLADNTFTQQ